MIITMQYEATQAEIDAVVTALRDLGVDPLVLPGQDRVAIGVPQTLTQDQKDHIETALGSLGGVNKITQTSRPYKLASLEFKRQKTAVKVGEAQIGPGHFTVMAGPCSIESLEQLSEAARAVKLAGAKILRGGAFKPRTSPYAFQGLAKEGLEIMQCVARESGLATVSEVMTPELVPLVADYVDILQIGARSMQNFPLLVEAGRSMKPILLKRSPSATIDEFLLAAEYVLAQGNPNVILCERGILPLDRSYTRNTLDLSAVPVLKDHTHLPVIVDPSHGTGVARYVAPMARAAMAAGADGLIVEVHPKPIEALSDGSQALMPEQFADLMSDLRQLASFMKLEI